MVENLSGMVANGLLAIDEGARPQVKGLVVVNGVTEAIIREAKGVV